MKYRLMRVIAILSFLIFGTLLFQCSKDSGVVKVGVLFPLTGDAASYGEKGQKAIELAVSEVNKSGGIHGSNVVAVFEDTKADPKTGVSAIRKLISVDHVPAIVGDIVSAVTLPVAPIAEENQVLLLSPTSSAPSITNAGKYIYRIWPSDLAEGKAIANFAFNHGYKKAAVLHLNNDYGLAIGQIFKETFTSLGASVVLIDGYAPDETDYRTLLSKTAGSKPDVVYIAGYFADTGRMLRQAQDLGLKVQFLGTTAIEDNKFLELTEAASEGIIYPLATGFDPASGNKESQDFVAAFKDKYSYDPAWVEAQSFDAFKLICYAMQKTSGEPSGPKIRAFFDSMGVYEGVTGQIRFDENGDVVKPVVIKTVKDGKFQRFPD